MVTAAYDAQRLFYPLFDKIIIKSTYERWRDFV